jgi:hypothetical protein
MTQTKKEDRLDKSTDETFIANFYAFSHPKRVQILEASGITMFSIIYMVHLNMSTLGCYNDNDRSLYITPTPSFNGTLAIQEIAYSVLLAGTDRNAEHYQYDKEKSVFFYKPSESNSELNPIEVPGLSKNQLHESNLELQKFCQGMYYESRTCSSSEGGGGGGGGTSSGVDRGSVSSKSGNSDRSNEILPFSATKPTVKLTELGLYGHKSDFFGAPLNFDGPAVGNSG